MKVKLVDMGTSGLMDWVNTGSRKTRPMRLGRAWKIINSRSGTEAADRFARACDRPKAELKENFWLGCDEPRAIRHKRLAKEVIGF